MITSLKEFFAIIGSEPAWATAFAAIIAPTISSLITCIFQYRIARVNISLPGKMKVFDSFMVSYSVCQYSEGSRRYTVYFYRTTMELIGLCNRSKTRRALMSLAHDVQKNGISKETDRKLEKCVKLFSKEL